MNQNNNNSNNLLESNQVGVDKIPTRAKNKSPISGAKNSIPTNAKKRKIDEIGVDRGDQN